MNVQPELPILEDADRRILLRVSRDTLVWCAEDSGQAFDFGGYEKTPVLAQKWATFVTLWVEESLRGCVGGIEPALPLLASVHANTVKAATEDPRFSAVRASEVPDIRVHLSILSGLQDIRGLEAFVVGRHGLIMVTGRSRALFLPEVAEELGWSAEETAAALCRKAGLDDNAWRRGARFSVFTTMGIDEE